MAMGKLKYLPLYIFAISLSLLWQTSMLGISVVGSDITGEYGVSSMVMRDGWDWTYFYGTSSGSSVVVGLLAPWIAKVTTLDLVMVYKLVFPFIFAFVPVMLFHAFRKMFGETRAFFATLFFMIVPIFNLEIVTIAKSMISEFFLALMILVMVSDWRTSWKIPAMIVSLGLATLCHYTVGILAIGFLLGCFIVRIITSRMEWSLFSKRKVSLLAMAIVLIVSGGIWYEYYSKASEGVIMRTVSRIGGSYMHTTEELLQKIEVGEPVEVEEPVKIEEPVKVEEPTKTEESMKVEKPAKTEEPTKAIYLQKQGPFVRAAIGLDFLEVSIAGKVFRVIQYITQAMIIFGCLCLPFKHREYKFTAEFVGCIGASFLLLLCCIFIPNFAGIINMTRFYHISLFFLAPMFVLGVEATSKGLTEIAKVCNNGK